MKASLRLRHRVRIFLAPVALSDQAHSPWSIRCLALTALLMAGCIPARLSEYEILSSQPTPQTWDLNKVWSLVVLDKDGKISQTLTVKFTDAAEKTCTSGEWKRLEILGERPAPHPSFLGRPAYTLEGRAIHIGLTPNLCDAYTDLRGSLTELGMSGTVETVSLFGGERLGRFYGIQVILADGV
jgi:hypothetical protein